MTTEDITSLITKAAMESAGYWHIMSVTDFDYVCSESLVPDGYSIKISAGRSHKLEILRVTARTREEAWSLVLLMLIQQGLKNSYQESVLLTRNGLKENNGHHNHLLSPLEEAQEKGAGDGYPT